MRFILRPQNTLELYYNYCKPQIAQRELFLFSAGGQELVRRPVVPAGGEDGAGGGHRGGRAEGGAGGDRAQLPAHHPARRRGGR